MVLPTRRTSAPSGKRVMMDDEDDDAQSGVESQCRSFPATPHHSKRRRVEDEDFESSTPPTGSSAGAESATTTDTKETEPFIEVSIHTCMTFPGRD
jgi:hypothetical protein